MQKRIPENTLAIQMTIQIQYSNKKKTTFKNQQKSTSMHEKLISDFKY